MTAPETIYGSDFTHNGRTVHIDPEQVLYAPDALSRLPALAECYADRKRVTVLADSRTCVVAGDDVAEALCQAGWTVQQILIPDVDGETPVCDSRTKDWIVAQLDDPALLCAVGSGVVNDLTKWSAATLDVPYVVVATAASMNGYTSANIAVTVDGIKGLERGNAPKLVLSTPAIIAEAPFEMTTSGLGDLLAKSVSSVDWRLNHLLFGDEYIEDSVCLINDIEPLYLENPEGVKKREPKAVRALFDGLMLTGVAMTMAGSSTPASGGEHLVSHTLDMKANLEGRKHDFHGRQVGVGTILTAALYENVLALESPDFAPAACTDFSYWGPLADPIAATYAPKIARLESACEQLRRGDRWDELRAALQPMLRPSEQIRDCLARAGGAYRAADLGINRAALAAAFAHGHEMRARFTILDLARIIGVDASRLV